MKISHILALETMAEVDQDTYNILNDLSIGRKRAATMIQDTTGIGVSEKLVRTYREGITAKPVENSFNENEVVKSAKKATDYINTYYNPFRPVYDAPGATYTTGTTVTFPVYKEKPKTIVIMPDVQAPLHDKVLVKKFTQFLKDYQPTELAQVGDFTDSTEISRWVRGKKGEFAGDLQAGFDSGIEILKDIREVFDGRFRIVRSNHDDRMELYIQGCAPGLSSLRNLSFENLMEFGKYDVEFIRDEVVELAPDWVMAHGDEGSLSQQAGQTALGLAKEKFGVSVVCGHSHRAGLSGKSYGYNGKTVRTISGLEVGHFMDMKVADYLKKSGAHANWQQAFGILEVYGQRVYPRLITVRDGHFSVDGVEY